MANFNVDNRFLYPTTRSQLWDALLSTSAIVRRESHSGGRGQVDYPPDLTISMNETATYNAAVEVSRRRTRATSGGCGLPV